MRQSCLSGPLLLFGDAPELPVADKEFFLLQKESRHSIRYEAEGRPNRFGFVAAITNLAMFVNQDVDLLFPRFRECGIVWRYHLLFVIPQVLGQFLNVSDKFVRQRMPSTQFTEISAPLSQPRIQFIHGFLDQLALCFRADFLALCHENAKRLHIYHLANEPLSESLAWLPRPLQTAPDDSAEPAEPAETADPEKAQEPDASGTDPWMGDTRDAPDQIGLSSKHCFDEALDSIADRLDVTDCV
jgi:hypothetical protein